MQFLVGDQLNKAPPRLVNQTLTSYRMDALWHQWSEQINLLRDRWALFGLLWVLMLTISNYMKIIKV